MLGTAGAHYAAFFRMPDVARMLAMAVLARMPLGTVTLGMLLHVRALTDSFAVAGATVGAYLAASAVTAPIVGRFIDRRGPHLALVVTGLVSPAALLVLWIAKPLGLSPAQMTAVAVVAGAFAPPITVLTRTMWRHRFESDADRRTAFALDAVLVELAFTAGPALIALLLAVGSPATAFGAAFFFTLVAVPTFLASPALRYWKHEPLGERHLLGPLREGRLVAVYATTFLITASLGLLEIAYPGFAAQVGSAPLAGVLLAVNAVGSAVGGLAFGALTWRLAPTRQLPRILGLMVLPLALQATIGNAGALALVAFIAGLCIAPALTVVTMLVSTYAPARYATEAFTWAATCIVSGIGAGNALGGVLLERFGAAVVFATSAAVALLAAGCAMVLALRLHRRGGL
jgi:MFS family permease